MILFVGAGPGDPELITVAGKRALEDADVIVYAGSLVPSALLKWAKPQAEVHNSASLNLDQILKILSDAYAAGKNVVRLQTGDPAIYGAIGEQMAELRRLGIPFRVIPGVSSFLAAAAALPAELTLPGVSQTIIVTRAPGRTAVPEGQDIASLAQHRATMAIFLSAELADETAAALLLHYLPTTPVAVVERASWPEERVLRCKLGELAETLRTNGVVRTAMILVGNVLTGEGELSKLYDAAFTHGYRTGTAP